MHLKPFLMVQFLMKEALYVPLRVLPHQEEKVGFLAPCQGQVDLWLYSESRTWVSSSVLLLDSM